MNGVSLRVQHVRSVSTMSRPRPLVAHSVYKLQTAGPLRTVKRCCYPVFQETQSTFVHANCLHRHGGSTDKLILSPSSLRVRSSITVICGIMAPL